MDVYHFVKGATAAFRDNAQRLKGLGLVHFETALVGPWDHITIIWDADVATAHEVVVELNSPGQSPPNAEDRPLDATTAVATALEQNFGPTRIRRSYHEAYEAYALITSTTPPDEELFADLNQLDGYTGSAMVDGIFDILLLIGGSTLEELQERLTTLHTMLRGRGRAEVCYQPPLEEGE